MSQVNREPGKAERVDLAAAAKPVRDFIAHFGKRRRPVELVLNGAVVAKLVPPFELSEAEKQRILDEGWAVVEKARAHTRGIPARVIQQKVAKAVREVRARHDRRRR